MIYICYIQKVKRIYREHNGNTYRYSSISGRHIYITFIGSFSVASKIVAEIGFFADECCANPASNSDDRAAGTPFSDWFGMRNRDPVNLLLASALST